MQQDIVSIPARRFQNVLKRWSPAPGPQSAAVQRILNWDTRLTPDSVPGLLYELWMAKLNGRGKLEATLKKLETQPDEKLLSSTLDETISNLTSQLGPTADRWQWNQSNKLTFHHP